MERLEVEELEELAEMFSCIEEAELEELAGAGVGGSSSIITSFLGFFGDNLRKEGIGFIGITGGTGGGLRGKVGPSGRRDVSSESKIVCGEVVTGAGALCVKIEELLGREELEELLSKYSKMLEDVLSFSG